jgi:two-component system chemotaxis response regulator CheY
VVAEIFIDGQTGVTVGQDFSLLSLLIIEPSRAQAQIIIGRLRGLGVQQLHHVRTGAEALAQIVAGDVPDLVLCAMYLPDMTGTDIIMHLRAELSTADVLFALHSSERAPRFLEPIRQAGVLSILKKPTTADMLQQLLRTVIELRTTENLRFRGYLDELKVLIVDDSRTARQFMRRVLESFGLEQFAESVDGEEAARLLSKESFDLIVTDLNMPNMDGIQLVEFIRNHSLRPEVPVVMVTSEQDPKRRGEAMASGISALCEKPFHPTLVRELLEGLLDAH